MKRNKNKKETDMRKFIQSRLNVGEYTQTISKTVRLLFSLEYLCCIKTLHHRQQFVLSKLLLDARFHSLGASLAH